MVFRISSKRNLFHYARTFKISSAIPSLSYHCNSLGPMTAHQNNLPRQPLPPLGPTLERYLKAVRPLVTDDEFKHTKKLVEEFDSHGGLGQKLYSFLQERYKTLDNWMGDWWLEMDFLEFRLPIVGFSNPSGYWAVEKFENLDDYLRYSSRLILALLDYKKHIDLHLLEPDKIEGELLDMSQYFRIFSSNRIPQKECDRLMSYGQEENPPKHIVVARNNQFYRLEVYDSQGNPLPVSSLFHSLKQIVSDSETYKDEPPIGVLTTENRDIWAENYEHIRSDNLNKKSLDVIQKAMFLLCLDKQPKIMNSPSPIIEKLQNFIHGGGSEYNGGNRWYDKCLQIIVCENGLIGHNMEHSPSEGFSLVKLVRHVLNYMSKTPVEWSSVENSTVPTKINFNFSKETLKAIDQAKHSLNNLRDDIDIKGLHFTDFGSDYIKSNGYSPDSFIQMAFQLAYYRLHGLRGVLYEVATLHKFLYGRMEIIHSTSTEAVEFCKTMLDYNASLREKVMALKIAVAAHKHAVNEAHRGEGLDTLLLGLKRAAREIGIEVPKLFEDYGFRMCYYYRLVTSQLPMKFELLGSFGPLFIDGYGLPYNVYPNYMHFFALSVFHRPESSSANLLQAIDCSLKEIKEVVDKAGKLDLKYDLNVSY